MAGRKPPIPPPPRRGYGSLLLGLVVLVALGALLWRAAGSTEPLVEIPDPRTAGMLEPVLRALTEAREAVERDPQSASAWGDLGAACDAHHLYEEAARCYRQAHALAPGDFRWVYLLAVVLDFQGAPAEEIDAWFGLALRLEPDYPPGYVRYGDALVRLGRLEDARTSFERALELDPDFAVAQRNLGQVLLSLGQDAPALEHLQRAAQLEPEDGVTLTSLAQAQWRAGQTDEAERTTALAATRNEVFGVPDPVRYAVDRRSVSPFATEQRARAAMGEGRWKDAMVDLELLLEMTPGVARLEADLGRCLARTGATGAARGHLERALELEPDQLGALAELALLEAQEGRLEEAQKHLERLTILAPGDGQVWKRLGSVRGQRGDLAGAVAAFARAAPTLASDAELQHNWGTALSRLGDQEQACRHFESALALQPDNAGTHFNLANALELLGRKDEAAEHYRRAGALDPRLPTAERLRALGR